MIRSIVGPVRKEIIYPQISQMGTDSNAEENDRRKSVQSADKK